MQRVIAIAVPSLDVNSLNMSWKRRAREGAYHHGNLREALIQAARELIKEKGPAGFTFADAARSAGVSPAAPYRHFRDREDHVVGDEVLPVELPQVVLRDVHQRLWRSATR